MQRKDKLKDSNRFVWFLVNCVGLRGTISHREPKNNKVDIGVEGASSGWTRASLQTALENYPPLSEIEIAVKDK